MKPIFSIIRALLLLIVAAAGLFLELTINEFGFFFGISLLLGAALTAMSLFLSFDKQINEKNLMEPIMDGFAGLVILTYPEVSSRFVLSDFSFWIAMMGILYLNSGFFNHQSSKFFWLYILTGLALIVFGFVIINYATEFLSSISYLMSFAAVIYSLVVIYLSLARSKAPLQP